MKIKRRVPGKDSRQYETIYEGACIKIELESGEVFHLTDNIFNDTLHINKLNGALMVSPPKGKGIIEIK